jgi:hypothetical protein
MAETYKIGIELALVGSLKEGLAAVASQLTGINKKVVEVEGGFKRWALLLGAGGIAGGLGILAGMKAIADQSERLNRAQNQPYRQTQSWGDVVNVTAAAYDKIAKAVPTAAASDVVRAVGDLRSVLGSTNAAVAAAPMSLMMEAVLHNQSGKDAAGEGFKLWRSLEMKGITQSNPELTNQLAGVMIQNIVGSNGKVDASTYQALAKRGGAAWIQANAAAIGPYSVAAGDLGGDTTGTALMTLDNLRSGATTLSRQQLEVLQSSGLVDMQKVHKIPGSNAMNIEPGAIFDSAKDEGNLYQWAQDIAPKLHEAAAKLALKDGVTEPQAYDSLIAKLGRNRNTIRLLKMFTDPGFIEQINKDQSLWSQSMPLNQAYAGMLGNAPNVAGPGGWNDAKGLGNADYGEVMGALKTQFQSLMEAVGGPVAQAAIPELKSMTSFFSSFGAMANANPGAIEQVAKGIGVLGVSLAGLGGAAVIAGAIAMTGPVGIAIAGVGVLLSGMVAIGPQVTAFYDSFNGLAAKAKGAIDGAFVSVESMLVSAISGIPGALAGAIRGIPGEIGGLLFGKGAAPGATPFAQPMHPPSAPRPADPFFGKHASNNTQPVNVKVAMYLDGKVIGQSTARQLTSQAMFPTQAAAGDTYASYVAGDWNANA